ncbi:MAG: leucine--tRNA ligase [Bacteroidales bacterium]|nr:leucine--tRNA ligase [Lachnoclostridium sp.]MCM1383006.1 leucine--tRNA ligase [Lachnoclostridium sp.]MCM1463940.1 leucine--tRNA ligase [Bacteroidales bacterium]
MSVPYNHHEVEQKWQKIWDDEKAFKTSEDYSKPKYYALVEFPYPSGQGLHVGHPRPYTALDIVARKRRMQGYNVLYPMGWDAFGLPTENYAIQNHIHPKIVTKNNVERFKQQLHSLGYSFDWDREVNTTETGYYKWTQWIFLKLFKAGLAYKSEMPINWCTSCKVGLANEEVVNGVCERCGSEVVRKVKSQWMLKITEYADKLLEGLESVDYIERVKVSQKNWIGKSQGAEVDFALTGKDEKLRVYTTRPDTLFGATYMVVAPEHPLVDKYKDEIRNWDAVAAYREMAARKSDFERTELAKDKTGVPLEGITATNPVNGKEIPIWISDYVLITYGTGAIMAVPAHDERDWDFAKKFNLPIIEVVAGSPVSVQEAVYTDVATGTLVNSEFLDGLSVADAKEKIIAFLEEKKIGTRKTNYKLRDWVFSRQRYWGEPIPIVHCEKCGYVPLDESELPLELPEVESYMPTDNGESPLAAMTDWVNTTCPCCGGPAKRETDTMPQWAGSSWYFLRYTDPLNDKALASKEALDYWMPVDWYNGGMEHTTLHLLYSRFWHRFLYDEGVVPCPEPYQKRTSHGMILGLNPHSFQNLPAAKQQELLGEYGSEEAAKAALREKFGEMADHPVVKMSKSLGNVVNPDDIVRDYGADTLRTYEMFIGAFDLSAAWSEDGVKGCRRFLERVWKLQDILVDGDEYSKDMETKMHQTIKKVGNDFESLKYNTAIAAMMALINDFYKKNAVTKGEYKTLLTLLNPIAPHITEELWQAAGYEGRLYQNTWPEYEEAKTVESVIEIAVQVNGKVRATVQIAKDEAKENVIAQAKEALGDKLSGTVVKEIYVPGKIVNIVVK